MTEQYPAEIINHLIQHRRSVKPSAYNQLPVDEKIIHQMLENARWAPTHGMTEPWRFIVFTGEGLEQFATFQSDLYKQTTSTELFNENKFLKLKTTPLKASHLILIGMKRQLNGKIPENEEICAVACAVQNMMLTATAYGIGCYWSTGGMTYHPEMKNFLGLESTDKCLGMLYIGNYDPQEISASRSPVSEKTRWVKGLYP